MPNTMGLLQPSGCKTSHHAKSVRIYVQHSDCCESQRLMPTFSRVTCPLELPANRRVSGRRELPTRTSRSATRRQ
ncbi:MAG: hypothetical protein JWQ43_494 [Glaciihabitans sp.]|nr:hypothetical protein [Glaciihabitans sp.]